MRYLPYRDIFYLSGSCFYNIGVTSPANTVWQDSVCVGDKCMQRTQCPTNCRQQLFITNECKYSNASLSYMEGLCKRHLNPINCSVYAYPGAQIIVLHRAVNTLMAREHQLKAVRRCGRVLGSTKCKPNNYGKQQHHGCRHGHYSPCMAHHSFCFSSVINCAGIAVPKQSNGNNVQAMLTVVNLAWYATAFKPDYSGQNVSSHASCRHGV